MRIDSRSDFKQKNKKIFASISWFRCFHYTLYCTSFATIEMLIKIFWNIWFRNYVKSAYVRVQCKSVSCSTYRIIIPEVNILINEYILRMTFEPRLQLQFQNVLKRFSLFHFQGVLIINANRSNLLQSIRDYTSSIF